MLANSRCVRLVVTLYTRSFVENVRIAGCDFFMQRDKFWVEVARRPRLVRKGTEVVHSSHQGSAIVSFQLPHIGRDIADGEADSSLLRRIRLGSMNNAHVVQGHLSWLQLQRYRLGLIHLYSYFLAARQSIVLRKSIFMRHLVERMRTGDDLHRTIRFFALRKCYPCCDDIRFGQSPVGRVLVPGDISGIIPFLDEKTARPAQ
jgi:hypothetical protein